jgi:hypothetical protein
MERHGDSAAAPEHAAPDQAGPDQVGPDQAGTGDDRVDEALARLGDLGALPVDEHPAVFEHVHRGLTAALGSLESGVEPGSALPGARGTSDRPATPGS